MRITHGLVTPLLLVPLALLAVAQAGDIEGPKESVPADQFVEVRYKLEKGDDVVWSVTPRPSKVKSFVLDGYSYVHFNGPSDTKYSVEADWINWDAKKRGRPTYEVVIGRAPIPPPKPDPKPVPPDPKPLPDGKLGLVKASREGFEKVTVARDKALVLAKAQRAHASAVAAGAFGGSAAKILDGWREANKGAVSAADYTEWGKVVSDRLLDLYKTNKLPSTIEWSEAFKEVAEGLGG